MISSTDFKYPYSPAMLDYYALGMEYLGGLELSAAAITTPTLVLPKRDILLIQIKITSLSASDVIAIQMGAGLTVDTTANYWSRNMASNGANTLGIVTFANTDHVNAVQWMTQYSSTNITLNDVGGTNSRSIFMVVSNSAGNPKTANWQTSRGTGTAATVPFLFIGGGAYRNATGNAQLTSILMKSAGGVATMGADSGFGVWGRNTP